MGRMEQALGWPTGKKYLLSFIEKGLLPATRKESNSFWFLPGTGRNSLLRYLSCYRIKAEEELGVDWGDLIWLVVNTDKEELVATTWLRMAKEQGVELKAKEGGGIFAILEELVEEKQRRIVLCVGMNEQGIRIEWLEALRQVNPLKIDFQFGFPFEVKLEEMRNYLGHLAQFGLQNTWYLPLCAEEDIEQVVKNQERWGKARVTGKEKEKIIELAGGYPRLARFFLRNPDKLEVKAWEEVEARHYFEGIWDGLKEESRDWGFKLAAGKQKLTNPSQYIEKTGLAKKKKGGWEWFSPLFEEYVKFLMVSSPVAVKEQGGVLEVGGKHVGTILSLQELAVFRRLWQDKGRVVTRDEVAKILWGKEWEEKYSDWAIDQVISRARKKLGDRVKVSLIKTLRGKGFMIEK